MMSLKGKTVVFTGKLSLSRAAMQKEAKSHGLKVGKSITKNVDYLVCGPQVAHNASNSKRKKAIAYNIEVCTEEEYRGLLTGKTSKPSKKESSTSKKRTTKKSPKNNSSINWDWLSSLTKSDLSDILTSLDDTRFRSSWVKGKLTQQITSYDPLQVIWAIPEEQCKKAMKKANLTLSRSRFRDQILLATHIGIKESTSLKLLNLLFFEDGSHSNQALILFEGLGTKEREEILSLFPQIEKDGVTQWSGDSGLRVIEDRTEIHVTNEMFNIGFLLHAIANPAKMKTIKKARIWALEEFSKEFLEHLLLLSSADIQFLIPQENGYFSITTNDFGGEITKLLGLNKTNNKPFEISVQNIPLIQWKEFPNVRHLRIIGDPKEQRPKFSELILQAVRGEWGTWRWRNWYSDQRGFYNINDENFPNLKTLTIQDNTVVGELAISASKMVEVSISNLSTLVALIIKSPVKKLQIKDCKEIRKMNINTQELSSYQLSPALATKVSEAVQFESQQKIAAHFTKQEREFINIVDDAVYGFAFEGEHSHIDHDEVWVEVLYYETSIPNLIEHIKYAFDPQNEDNFEYHGLRTLIFSDEFQLDMECDTESAYDLDYYGLARWKNRACSVEPEVYCAGRSYTHDEDSEDYHLISEPIADACGVYGVHYGALILEYLSPKQMKELAALYRKLNLDD